MTDSKAFPDLLKEAEALQGALSRWRRHLHRYPELSFREFQTQEYLRQQLVALGCQPRNVAETGLLVDILPLDKENTFRKVLALRADIDALPIQELEGRVYGSAHPGVMHACGHDVHSACLLGAAALLQQNRHRLHGPVRLIFQPGEELLPGGATKVIADGGLDGVGSIIALHVSPDLPVGHYGIKSGAYMASADEIYLHLRGPGGHAALPHLSVDLVAVAAQMITSLQQVVSRKAPAAVPTVLSFGSIISDSESTNVLSRHIAIKGTLRTYDDTWRFKAHNWIERICRQTAEMYGAELELEIRKGYPPLNNDTGISQELRKCLVGLTAEGQVRNLEIRPTAEDFAWYLQKVPGCFFRLGTGIGPGVHTPEFDIDEASMPYGAAALASFALAYPCD